MDNSSMKADLEKCVSHLKEELAQLRTGRATAELLEPVKVDAYGSTAPLKNYGNISVADAKSLLVQVWDKSIIDDVEKGLQAANLGFGISREGDQIRVKVPELTEDRRKDLVRVMKERVETGRIAVRNVRHEYMKEIEELVKSGMSEDEGKRMKDIVEQEVKNCMSQIDEIRDIKEKDLMTV